MEKFQEKFEHGFQIGKQNFGVFDLLSQSVENFKQNQEELSELEFPDEFETSQEENFMINLTGFEKNLKYSPEYQQVFTTNIKVDEQFSIKSFDSTLSATEIENDMDIDDVKMELDTSIHMDKAFDDIEQFFNEGNPEDWLKKPEEFPVLEIQKEKVKEVFGMAEIQGATNLTQVFLNETRHFQNQLKAFPNKPVLQTDSSFIQKEPKPVQYVLQSQFQQTKSTTAQNIQPATTQQAQSMKIVKVPILNENKEVIREEFVCEICTTTYTAITSLTRHLKTQKHKLKEMKMNGTVAKDQGWNFGPQRVQNLNYSSIQAAIPPQRQVAVPIKNIQPRSQNLDQLRLKFIQKIRESRKQIVDNNRANLENQSTENNEFVIIQHDSVLPPQESTEQIKVVDEIVEEINQEFGGNISNVAEISTNLPEVIESITETPRSIDSVVPTQTSPTNATKAAIQNSIKILSKLNTERSQKSLQQSGLNKSSPKKSVLKQSNLKQLILRDLAFNKSTTTQNAPVTSGSQEDAPAQLEMPQIVRSEPTQVQSQSELAKYIQSMSEEIWQFEIEESQLEAQDPTEVQFIMVDESLQSMTQVGQNPAQEINNRQSVLAKLMNERRKQRIQKAEKPSAGNGHFQCKDCPKSFTTLSNLRRHEHLHGTKKLHQCHICERKFMQKEYLKKHMTTHSGQFK